MKRSLKGLVGARLMFGCSVAYATGDISCYGHQSETNHFACNISPWNSGNCVWWAAWRFLTNFFILDEHRELLDDVVLSGGEPTLWQELSLLPQKIKARSSLVKLDTNGSNPGMLKLLLVEHLVDYTAMDVKTALAEYPKLVGPLIKPESLEESIDILRSSSLLYEFRTTMVRGVHTSVVLEAIR